MYHILMTETGVALQPKLFNTLVRNQFDKIVLTVYVHKVFREGRLNEEDKERPKKNPMF